MLRRAWPRSRPGARWAPIRGRRSADGTEQSACGPTPAEHPPQPGPPRRTGTGLNERSEQLMRIWPSIGQHHGPVQGGAGGDAVGEPAAGRLGQAGYGHRVESVRDWRRPSEEFPGFGAGIAARPAAESGVWFGCVNNGKLGWGRRSARSRRQSRRPRGCHPDIGQSMHHDVATSRLRRRSASTKPHLTEPRRRSPPQQRRQRWWSMSSSRHRRLACGSTL
jgi:hypothetical protein